jgi:hypothetical protein
VLPGKNVNVAIAEYDTTKAQMKLYEKLRFVDRSVCYLYTDCGLRPETRRNREGTYR